jgi:hypothetical protein
VWLECRIALRLSNLQNQRHITRLVIAARLSSTLVCTPNDAEGICEAVGRPNMRFVAVKRVEQQVTALIHLRPVNENMQNFLDIFTNARV